MSNGTFSSSTMPRSDDAKAAIIALCRMEMYDPSDKEHQQTKACIEQFVSHLDIGVLKSIAMKTATGGLHKLLEATFEEISILKTYCDGLKNRIPYYSLINTPFGYDTYEHKYVDLIEAINVSYYKIDLLLKPDEISAHRKRVDREGHPRLTKIMTTIESGANCWYESWPQQDIEAWRKISGHDEETFLDLIGLSIAGGHPSKPYLTVNVIGDVDKIAEPLVTIARNYVTHIILREHNYPELLLASLDAGNR